MTDDPEIAYVVAIESEPILDYVSFPGLLAQFRAGNTQARQTILGASLRVSYAAAQQWSARHGQTISLDAVQEANAALVKALESFTGSRLDEFEGWINAKVIQHLDRGRLHDGR